MDMFDENEKNLQLTMNCSQRRICFLDVEIIAQQESL